MEYDDVNKPRGVLMLLAMIILLITSFSSHEAQATGSWQDARPYKLSNYQVEREKRDLVTIYTGFTDRQIG